MNNYAGNPSNYPAQVRLPSGGDLRNAQSVNTALEDLADRTAFLADLWPASFLEYADLSTQFSSDTQAPTDLFAGNKSPLAVALIHVPATVAGGRFVRLPPPATPSRGGALILVRLQ